MSGTNQMLLYLSKQVNSEITIISDELARGAAGDYGEYRYLCGRVRGLMVANDLLRAAAEKMQMGEEFDD